MCASDGVSLKTSLPTWATGHRAIVLVERKMTARTPRITADGKLHFSKEPIGELIACLPSLASPLTLLSWLGILGSVKSPLCVELPVMDGHHMMRLRNHPELEAAHSSEPWAALLILRLSCARLVTASIILVAVSLCSASITCDNATWLSFVENGFG